MQSRDRESEQAALLCIVDEFVKIAKRVRKHNVVRVILASNLSENVARMVGEMMMHT